MTEPKMRPELTPELEADLRRYRDDALEAGDTAVAEALAWFLWEQFEKPAIWRSWVRS